MRHVHRLTTFQATMAKSDKATVSRRVQDVVRLLLAGAEFAEIRQYASALEWGVSDRQLRRYVERAYKRLAKSTARDRDQLLGRHLMQRRALYARSIKGNDLRTALQILRDEANLQGLYPPTKIAPTTPDGKRPYSLDSPGLSRQERLVRQIAAEVRGDNAELQLIGQATPDCVYRLPDTMMPLQILHILALVYINEQLEQAGIFLHAMWRATVEEDVDGTWDLVAHLAAFRFRIGREAWEQFTQKTSIDARYLIDGNYQGALLDLCQDNICRLAPTADEVALIIKQSGREVGALQSADGLARSWRRLLTQVCGG